MKAYVTFGWGHVHEINGHILDKDCVGVFESKNAIEAEEIVLGTFGQKFSMEYFDSEWDEESIKYYHRGYIHFERV